MLVCNENRQSYSQTWQDRVYQGKTSLDSSAYIKEGASDLTP